MIVLAGYDVKEKIYESESSIIYRGLRNSDNKSVILKLLKEEYPSLEKVSRFLHEHEILKKLNESEPTTVSVYDLARYHNSFVLILEDGGQDLKNYLTTKQKLQLTEAIKIAIQISESLDIIHKFHIIHKDINPSNILLNSTGEKLKIIDFGISSSLPKEILEVFSLNRLEGTLPYLSPEQTGRMNRGIDYRSDYYSLGVTLYQIFTSTLPFTSKDTLELVYAHIAKTPPTPNEVDPAIPKILSDIIMKLLEKNAEKRYQSSFGLISDLNHCLIELQKTGSIKEFPLAKNDLSSRFQVPDKLYGREAEIEILLNKFYEVSKGRSQLVLVAGNSGIGKTSLVREVHKPVVEKHGYFISGKFDQLKKNIPYAPFVQAFENLIQQLLTEDEDKIKQWKEKITTALGPNGSVMTEVLPSLEKIIGNQPVLPTLGPAETQNRFISVFQSFVQVIATEDHPIVLFLDDLQWIDLASLKLLNSLLIHPEIMHLLIIGAYRDNEVNESHPLMLTLENLHAGKIITVETLTINPLKVSDIGQLLSETLSQELDMVTALAETCHAKTLGNPFYLNQFLKILCNENLIVFDMKESAWRWQIEKIKTQTGTNNMIDLVISNIQKLLPETRKVLALSACLGAHFNLQLLSALHDKSPKQTAETLEEALRENFLLPLSESYRFVSDSKDANVNYKFIHDRVQQASYSLLNDEEKHTNHLTIGRILLNKYPSDEKDEKIFDIVNQFNLGINLITSEEEKKKLTQLNLRAGYKAKNSAAYSMALEYFNFGIQLLGKDSWETDYNTTLQLYTESAESAYLCNDFAKSTYYGDIVIEHAKSILDQVKIYEIKIYSYIAQNTPEEAVETSLMILKKLGFPLPEKPTKLDLLKSLIKSKWLLLFKNDKKLINLPILTNPYKLNACNILSSAIAPTYYAAPDLFPLCSLNLFNFSIKYGYSKGTPAAYATYGIILCDVLSDIDKGYLFGDRALKLVENFHATESESKIPLMVYAFIKHWKDPLRSSMAPLLVAHVRGIEIGDLDYSAYSAYFYLVSAFYSGVELPQQAKDTRKFYETCKNQYTHGIVLHSIALHGEIIDSLRGLSKNPCSFTGQWYQEDAMLQEAINMKHGFEVFHFYVLKLLMNYLFYDYKEAQKYSLKIPACLGASTGSIPLKAYNFYDSLNLLALYKTADKKEKKEILKKVATNQKKLKYWAKESPENCLHKYYLVEAELSRVLGKINKAEDYYSQAIELAKQHEFVQEHGLANELAAKFYFDSGKEMIAKGYMAEAYYSYIKWGAAAKINHLEKNYPTLLTKMATTALSINNNGEFRSKTNYATDSLDLTTIVKTSQTIAREIVLANLLQQLMHFLIENAGAQKGYLLLEKDEKWTIEASINGDKVTVLQSLPLKNLVPQSIIHYVIRSNESVVIDDGTEENNFISDPYIVQNSPKSILVMPLLNQGVLSGILYLENNLIAGAFTQNRVDLLNLLSGQIIISIENARLYTGMANLNRAYERFIPKEFLKLLEKKNIIDVNLGDQVQKDMTIMFCDIRNFTTISEKLTPQENFVFVNHYLSLFGPIISEHEGFIDKYMGDAIMAIYPTNTDAALTCAIQMLKALSEYNQAHPDQSPVRIGIGLNSGLLMLGVVGAEHHMEGTVISDVVNVASRTEDLTKVYSVELLITEDTYKRLRNPNMYGIRRLDTVLAKGKSKPTTIYEVFDGDVEAIKNLKIKTKDTFEQGVDHFQNNNFREAHNVFQNILNMNPTDEPAKLYLKRCSVHDK